MKAFTEFEAYDELAKDALANCSLAAMDRSRDAHFIVPAGCSGSVISQPDMAEGGVDQHLGAIALLVGIVEELGYDDSVFIRHVASGKGDAVDWKFTWLNFGVEDVVSPDYIGSDIREQRVGYFLLLRELGKNLLVVIGNGVEANARCFELRVGIAQLPELRPAGGSPDRGPKKDDYGPVAGTIFVETNFAAVLVGQGEIGQAVAQPGAGGVAFGKARPAGVLERRRRIKPEFVAFHRHRAQIL